MRTLDDTVFHFLNGVLGYNRIIVEAAYFLADCAPTMVISVLATYFLVETRRRDYIRWTIIICIVSACLAWVAAYLMTDWMFRPHPRDVLESARPLISTFQDSSMPNITTAWLSAIAVTMLQSDNKVLRGFLVTLAILFGISRPILGDHWPTDILVSFVLGWLAAQLTFKLAKVIPPFSNRFLRAER